jgi:hypothetical protein
VQGQVMVGTRPLTRLDHFKVGVGMSRTVQGRFKARSRARNGKYISRSSKGQGKDSSSIAQGQVKVGSRSMADLDQFKFR